MPARPPARTSKRNGAPSQAGRDPSAKKPPKRTSGRAGARAASSSGRGNSPGAPRRAARSDGIATRAKVLDAAAELFARDGYEGASLRGIAAEAEIDIATLKYHFGDKDALFAAVYRDGYEQFQSAVGPLLMRVPLARNVVELEAEVKTILERAYDYLDHHERFVRLWIYRLLESPRAVVEAEETARSNIMALIEAGVGILRERGLVRDVDVRVMVLLLLTAVPTLSLGARARPELLGPSSLPQRERFVQFFLEMLRRQLLSAPA